MTRKKEEATAGLRRGRTLATAGLGAATLIGGLVYAMPANAAGTVTASLTPASASVINDGTSSDALTIKVNNGTATALTANVGYRFVLTVPNDSTCAGVSLTADAADATAPTIAQTPGTCQWTTATTQTVAAGGSASDIYDLAVTSGSGATGTVSIAATVVEGGAGDLATANASVQLVGPGAATFSKVPSAVIKQNYSAQLFTPPTGGSSPTYTVYQSQSHQDPTTKVTTTCYVQTYSGGVGTVDLNDNLVLDLSTGKVQSVFPDGAKAGDPGPAGESTTTPPTFATDSAPASYIVIANNNTGGAGATVAAGTCADPAIGGGVSTPAVAVHDVSSGAFQVPVLFKDVPLTAKFAPAIYALGDSGQSTGYADGSYQPTNPISRQAMASMLDSRNNPLGPIATCASATDSPYSDVPYTSQFCPAIVDTSNVGLFNGYTDGTFKPAKDISRQAISAVLFREYSLDRLGSTGGGDAACTTPVPFNDVSTQNQFCGDIEWMSTNGLSKGYTDGGFHPAANASRQAVAQFLYQLNALENP
jgi:hypothetical protein